MLSNPHKSDNTTERRANLSYRFRFVKHFVQIGDLFVLQRQFVLQFPLMMRIVRRLVRRGVLDDIGQIQNLSPSH